MSYIGLGPASAALTSSGTANSFNTSPSMAGSLTAATGLTATTGDLTITSGAVSLNDASFNAVINNASGTVFISQQTGLGGTQNIYVGVGAGNTTGTGNSNTSIGTGALEAITIGATNVGVGTTTLGSLTSGNSNTCVGSSVMSSLLTGQFNIAVGFFSGSSYTGAESSNVLINAVGTVGESHVIRIGTDGSSDNQQNKCFIAGIFGVTVGGSGVPVNVDNAGQLGTVVSSKRFKENIVDIEDTSKVLTLRPVNFNFIKDSAKTKQWGLIAEEVHESYPALVVYDNDRLPYTVRYNDLPVLLLNEIKKLVKRIEVLEQNVK